MENPVAVLALGFVLGMRHATDADHVVAVGTLVARERTVKTAALLGALWGVGHTLTILLVGGAIVGFGLVLPTRLGLAMEFCVSVMLVVLGGINVAGSFGAVDGRGRAHRHVAASWIGRVGPFRAFRSLAVGVVHGLAGSAAVALMVLATIRGAASAVLYLAVFGVGTIAGMMLITSALAVPLAASASRFGRVNRHLAWISGVLSVGFGLVLAYEIGIRDGLFTAHPRWDPR